MAPEQLMFEFMLSGAYMAHVAAAVRGYYGKTLSPELDAFCSLIDSAYVYAKSAGTLPRFVFRAMEIVKDDGP